MSIKTAERDCENCIHYTTIAGESGCMEWGCEYEQKYDKRTLDRILEIIDRHIVIQEMKHTEASDISHEIIAEIRATEVKGIRDEILALKGGEQE